MALQLKSNSDNGGDENQQPEEKNVLPDGTEKYVSPQDIAKRVGADTDGLPPIKVEVLPTSNIKVTDPRRNLIQKIGIVVVLAALFITACILIRNHLKSGGKDISTYLNQSEDQIAANLGITFEPNEKKAKMIPQYSGGKVTVRSGSGLDIVYVDGKQVGVNSSSEKYRFFGVGIKDIYASLSKKTTYKFEGSFVVAGDFMEGNSTSYFFYNKKENTLLVYTTNEHSGKVVNMTYFTDLKTVTKCLTFGDDDEASDE